LVLEDDLPRRDAELPHPLEVQHALPGDVAAVHPDPDAVGLGVRADHPQGVLQADRLRVHQVAQQRGGAPPAAEPVHQLVLRLRGAFVAWITGAKYRPIAGSRYDATPPGPANARHGTPARNACPPGKPQISTGSVTSSPGCEASTASQSSVGKARVAAWSAN